MSAVEGSLKALVNSFSFTGGMGLVVLESIRQDNAIYIFDLGWEAFSRLSKAEVLANNFQLHRIVHTVGWKDRLRQVMYGSVPTRPRVPV